MKKNNGKDVERLSETHVRNIGFYTRGNRLCA